ncbi:putative sporulation protein YtxC [Neobacillus ginsengisoli]|uniref:Sporulation protein YtxC n=1 Tax=Neobacillus ginsengisoli TaxID=904295 RepID=A0ABT9XPX2_9BACI|nr:putative sporulation protein YtxC [Neobacillus ginsengisoli]MDQ0197039.1 putative sporulation protein YtxC [Neobacillus ginsengisoli]
MAEIIFQSKMDAIRFYNHLLKCLSYNPANNEILLYEDRNIVKIMDGNLSLAVMKKTKDAFYEFIMKIKQDDWLRGILKEHYYYEDPEEQQQILEIIYTILEGQREDLAAFLKETSEEPNIRAAIEQIFHDNVSFSVDSFLKFRLRSYLQRLKNYVEISIDEYKMEQEYQMFVQTLREFLANREPKMDILHLLFDEEITFYTEEFDEIKRGELIKMVDRKLLVNHPVYVDSVSIAPLLSLAPTTIFLYAKNPDEPLIRTIKNIFEERVTIKSFDALRSTKKLLLKDDTASENHG